MYLLVTLASSYLAHDALHGEFAGDVIASALSHHEHDDLVIYLHGADEV